MNNSLLNNLIFIHGGPGFNSNPEKHLLASVNPKIHCWSEPSTLRGLSAPVNFEQATADILDFIHKTKPTKILFHSFGTQYLLGLVSQLPDCVQELFLIAPAFDLHATDLNILNLSVNDWTRNGEAVKAQELNLKIDTISRRFDQNKLETLLLASSNQELFLHYFHQKLAIAQYFSYINENFVFDFENFKSLRFTTRDLIELKVDIPTTVIWGRHDPISKQSDQQEFIDHNFSKVKHIVFEGSAHYPHIEEKEKFLDLLK